MSSKKEDLIKEFKQAAKAGKTTRLDDAAKAIDEYNIAETTITKKIRISVKEANELAKGEDTLIKNRLTGSNKYTFIRNSVRGGKTRRGRGSRTRTRRA